mgnify:CR=1 FL=1
MGTPVNEKGTYTFVKSVRPLLHSSLLIFVSMSSRIILEVARRTRNGRDDEGSIRCDGGDNAPAEIVKGAVDALTREKGLYIFLVGQEDAVKNELEKYTYDKDRIEVVPATEVIEMAEPPVNAIRKKKDSSIVVGMKLVKEGRADALYRPEVPEPSW